jgi:hypothetical protein
VDVAGPFSKSVVSDFCVASNTNKDKLYNLDVMNSFTKGRLGETLIKVQRILKDVKLKQMMAAKTRQALVRSRY